MYSLYHPEDYGKNGYFADQNEALNKNADNEDADMFSILDQLEQYRTCDGQLHFKLCYPELAENFSFPCNEWTQSNNPAVEPILKGFEPITITFKSKVKDFVGLGLATRGREGHLMEDHPYNSLNRAFSIGTIAGEGKIPGPGFGAVEDMVEKVELYVNPGAVFSYNQGQPQV